MRLIFKMLLFSYKVCEFFSKNAQKTASKLAFLEVMKCAISTLHYNCSRDLALLSKSLVTASTNRLQFVHILMNNYTAWKVSIFGAFLDRIFPHLDWIRSDTPYLSVFSRTPFSVQMQENTNQKNSEYRHFSRSVGNI